LFNPREWIEHTPPTVQPPFESQSDSFGEWQSKLASGPAKSAAVCVTENLELVAISYGGRIVAGDIGNGDNQ
jgi:hypothetical protein